MAVLSWWVRSLDSTLPSGVTYSCASRRSASSHPATESRSGNTRLHHITTPLLLHGSSPDHSMRLVPIDLKQHKAYTKHRIAGVRRFTSDYNHVHESLQFSVPCRMG